MAGRPLAGRLVPIRCRCLSPRECRAAQSWRGRPRETQRPSSGAADDSVLAVAREDRCPRRDQGETKARPRRDQGEAGVSRRGAATPPQGPQRHLGERTAHRVEHDVELTYGHRPDTYGCRSDTYGCRLPTLTSSAPTVAGCLRFQASCIWLHMVAARRAHRRLPHRPAPP